MNLKKQIQLLINNAPRDGITPHLVSAIAPVLITVAKKLRHPQYYILQNSEESWVLTTLSNRANPGWEKRVIYAFPTIQDVSLISHAGLDPQMLAKIVPVTHILFQLVALEPVDSVVFLETPGQTTHTLEIQRSELQNLLQEKIKQQQRGKHIPPDIA
ncbi:hypothetical protein [Umezakia ovalisporum]|jgi:hypothetical protein|uniref:Uncharacterized protein n=2 Tax=Umezakia ovalisporum TaxID=75695 RepID=A0AA43GWV0_9CYAN|nr:hypothetical protein [Umezakia ovalisporum]MBI1242601.1 hypothetical protein [Nostoc sp. RI_552]MDH6057959.1 hypothetical protein [Umezakia ovalisporum FSS-43]MDH6063040.1 hypothetical protein [Umezakia ovalisporum FSS-62]MDH6066879.1 hypothetical protein [Umezakia ovalisporum APH033B]MDH6071982.1 hypothetical protein [Umezakia ovalisporum CobakiLakeA]